MGYSTLLPTVPGVLLRNFHFVHGELSGSPQKGIAVGGSTVRGYASVFLTQLLNNSTSEQKDSQGMNEASMKAKVWIAEGELWLICSKGLDCQRRPVIDFTEAMCTLLGGF